jgi:hypothetical protein
LSAGDVVLCSAEAGWVAPAAAKADKKKKKGKGEEGGQQQQQQQQSGGGADAELDPEKAAKKVRGWVQRSVAGRCMGRALALRNSILTALSTCLLLAVACGCSGVCAQDAQKT